jgi:hypothetical protein
VCSYFRRKRRIAWIHDINLSSEELGEFYTSIPKLLKDEKRFPSVASVCAAHSVNSHFRPECYVIPNRIASVWLGCFAFSTEESVDVMLSRNPAHCTEIGDFDFIVCFALISFTERVFNCIDLPILMGTAAVTKCYTELCAIYDRGN